MKRLITLLTIVCFLFGCVSAPTVPTSQDIVEPEVESKIVWYFPDDCESECGTLPQEGITWGLIMEPVVYDNNIVRLLAGTEALWMDMMVLPIYDFDDNIYSFVVSYAIGSGHGYGVGCVYSPEDNKYIKHAIPPTSETYTKMERVSEWFMKFVYKGKVEVEKHTWED